MATVIDRTGTIFKKCDRKGHKPNSNKRCAAGAGQHTCDNSEKYAWIGADADGNRAPGRPRHRTRYILIICVSSYNLISCRHLPPPGAPATG